MTERTSRLRADVVLAFTFGATFLATIMGVAVFVRDPSPLLITVIKITIALAAAGVSATMPGFLSFSFSPMASAALRAGGALAVFAIVFFFTPAGLIPTSYKAAPKPPEQAHTIVTRRLGLQFQQDGQVLPILYEGNDTGVVMLRRQAFTITLPRRTWRTRADDYPALQITVSANPQIAGLVNIGGSGEENPFFQPGTGVADYEYGDGQLWAVSDLSDRPFSHNYIVGGRFNVEEEFERRGVYVSSIVTDSSSKQNLIRTAEHIYMIFRLDEAPSVDLKPTILDISNLDLVKLDFK